MRTATDPIRYIIYVLLFLPATFSRSVHIGRKNGRLNSPLVDEARHKRIKKPFPRIRIHLTPGLISNAISNDDLRIGDFGSRNETSSTTLSPIFAVIRNSLLGFIQATKPIHLNQLAITSTFPTLIATSTISLLLIRNLRRKEHKLNDGPKLAPTNEYLRALTFWRRAGPIVAHYKFTQAWFKVKQHPFEKRDKIWEEIHTKYAPEAYNIIAEFRGVFVKIGQVLSSRPDFMPQQYITLFASFQDALPPKPFHEIKRIVDESLQQQNETLQFEDVFEWFDELPLGTASIGQVHRASLKPEFYEQCKKTTLDKTKKYSGSQMVAVKVMHPAAEKQFQNDFKLFLRLSRIAMPGWWAFLDEVRKQLMTEFDFQNEAASLHDVRRNMEESTYSKHIKIPEPIDALCSRNLLVMEFLQGKKLSDHMLEELALALDGDMDLANDIVRSKRKEFMLKTLKEKDESIEANTTTKTKKKSNWRKALGEIKSVAGDDKFNNPISQARLLAKLWSMRNRMRTSLEILMNVHGHQIFIDGVFNGDPHPGNIMQLDDGRLGLIDYGQVKRLRPEDRIALSKMFVVFDKGIGEECHDDIANALREIGFKTQRDRTDVIAPLGILFFDTTALCRKAGYLNPQDYFQDLIDMDPIVSVPRQTVMVVRTCLLLRGMGNLLQTELRASNFWTNHAKKALDIQEEESRKMAVAQ